MEAPTLLHRPQIDDEAWNDLIDKSLNSVIYAQAWYLDCVSPDWQALVWPSARNYEIVMPLPVVRKWGMNVVQQPLFCQYLGLFSEKALSEPEIAAFLEALGGYFRYVSVYSFHPRHSAILGKVLSSNPDFEFLEKSTHWLILESTYESVAKKYRSDRMKNLKKSKKHRWEIIESQDVEPLIKLFQENHADQIQNVKESAYTLLRNLAKVVFEKNKGRIRYALQNGDIQAGVMILENNGMGIYIFNAANEPGRTGNARTFMLDQYFQQKAGQLKVFDFESPEVASIASFYESFGAEKQEFIAIKRNKLPFPLRQLQEFRKYLIPKLTYP